MLPSEDVVSEMTRIVWSTMLGLEAVAGLEAAEAAAFVTSVDISGAWEGTVSISFTRSLAQKVTAAMLASAAPDSTDATVAEVSDAIGELANMVGGNVKGLFAGPCKLSIPRVEPASAALPLGTGSRCWFECGGQPFSVTVLERTAGSGDS